MQSASKPSISAEDVAARAEHEKRMEQFKPPSSFFDVWRKDPVIATGASITIGILAAGLITMFTGKSSTSQKLMRARVVAQGITVVAVAFSGWRLKKASEEYNAEMAKVNPAWLVTNSKGDYKPSAHTLLKKNPAILRAKPLPTPQLSTPTSSVPVPVVKQPPPMHSTTPTTTQTTASIAATSDKATPTAPVQKQ